MNQISIQFPGDVDFESFWSRLGALRPVPKTEPVASVAKDSSSQLIIAETEINIALRYSFRVPVYSKKGKLKSWDLKHVCISNVISLEDFGAKKSEGGFEYNANRLAAEFMEGMQNRVVKKLGLNEEQAKLVEFRGLSVARHLACTNVPVGDPRWI